MGFTATTSPGPPLLRVNWSEATDTGGRGWSALMLPRIGKQGRRIVPFIFRASAEKHHSVAVAIEDQSMTQARSRSYVLSLSPKLSVELPGVSQDVRGTGPSEQDHCVRQARHTGVFAAGRPEFRELSPGLAIPCPSVAPGGMTAKQDNTFARGIVRHNVRSARRWPDVFLLGPILAAEFPGVLKKTEIPPRTHGTVTAEQHRAFPPGIERHGMRKTSAWTEIRQLRPLFAIPFARCRSDWRLPRWRQR